MRVLNEGHWYNTESDLAQTSLVSHILVKAYTPKRHKAQCLLHPHIICPSTRVTSKSGCSQLELPFALGPIAHAGPVVDLYPPPPPCWSCHCLVFSSQSTPVYSFTISLCSHDKWGSWCSSKRLRIFQVTTCRTHQWCTVTWLWGLTPLLHHAGYPIEPQEAKTP